MVQVVLDKSKLKEYEENLRKKKKRKNFIPNILEDKLNEIQEEKNTLMFNNLD